MSLREVVALKRDIKAHLKARGIDDVTIEVENIDNCSNNAPVKTSHESNTDK